MRFNKSAVAVTVFLCASIIFGADMVLLDQNDFSTSKGNWKFKAWGNSSTQKATMVDGWARVDCGGSGDFWTNECDACCLYYPVPTGDFIFETGIRQPAYSGGHHAGNKTLMLRSGMTGALTEVSICLIDKGGIETMTLTGGNAIMADYATVPYSSYSHIRLTRTGTTFTFFASTDSVTWTQVSDAFSNNSIKGNMTYICLTDTYNDSYTEYNYAMLWGTPQTGITFKTRELLCPRQPISNS